MDLETVPVMHRVVDSETVTVMMKKSVRMRARPAQTWMTIGVRAGSLYPATVPAVAAAAAAALTGTGVFAAHVPSAVCVQRYLSKSSCPVCLSAVLAPNTLCCV